MLREMIQFDLRIFCQMGWNSTTNQLFWSWPGRCCGHGGVSGANPKKTGPADVFFANCLWGFCVFLKLYPEKNHGLLMLLVFIYAKLGFWDRKKHWDEFWLSFLTFLFVMSSFSDGWSLFYLWDITILDDSGRIDFFFKKFPTMRVCGAPSAYPSTLRNCQGCWHGSEWCPFWYQHKPSRLFGCLVSWFSCICLVSILS